MKKKTHFNTTQRMSWRVVSLVDDIHGGWLISPFSMNTRAKLWLARLSAAKD